MPLQCVLLQQMFACGQTTLLHSCLLGTRVSVMEYAVLPTASEFVYLLPSAR